MTQELRRLAEAAVPKPIGNMLSATEKSSRWNSVYESRVALSAACTPAAILELLDRLEKAEKDAARLDWLEASTEMHGFCHIGYGDFRYYAHQQDGCKTVRQVIDAAMEASK